MIGKEGTKSRNNQANARPPFTLSDAFTEFSTRCRSNHHTDCRRGSAHTASYLYSLSSSVSIVDSGQHDSQTQNE